MATCYRDPVERAILAAIPPFVAEQAPGAIASAMVTVDGSIVDGWVRVGGPPGEVSRRGSTESDPDVLGRWMNLLRRRRAALAHEIAGPATGVLAALETVLEFEPIPSSTRELLEDGRAGMFVLTKILGASQRRGTPPVGVVEGDLNRALVRWTTHLAERFDPDGSRLRIEVATHTEELRIDTSRLEPAVDALLSNAWRFRRGEATISVRGHVRDGWVCVEVEDDGQGVEDEATLIQCGELGFTTRRLGLGLGLFGARWSLRDRGAIVIRPLERGVRATVFLRSNTPAT